MHKWGEQKPVRFDEKELKTDLGSGNTIFVGSSCDMFADDINSTWVIKTLDHCRKYDNKYLFQSKNPSAFNGYGVSMPDDMILCTTIETNRHYPEFMGDTPSTIARAFVMSKIPVHDTLRLHITIEPIMAFDGRPMVDLVLGSYPDQINIGADSGNNGLPEPDKDRILWLIEELEPYTDVVLKPNLKRLLK